jgi:hypothetical protein
MSTRTARSACAAPRTADRASGFNRVPEPKTVKDRIHLDVTLEPGQEIPDLLRLGRHRGHGAG